MNTSAFIYLCGLIAGTRLLSAEVPPPPDFASEVLPILSDKCFACHGPDAKESELKLTSYDESTKRHHGVRAIAPENLSQSELLYRITDDEDPMPPSDAKPLSERERSLLTHWIQSGAAYAKHWAFVPPQQHHPLENLDEFIQEKLRTHGLDFSPEADRRTIARRAALVLTGLPPSKNAFRRFLASTEATAFEIFVDELLASEHYGEHRARYWLDAVRYGDTAGLARDVRRGLYPYRDWVIQALNDNLPMDQFITWQLAGDLLPNPSLEQMVATGYVRMNPTTNEGGTLPEEFQAKNNFDRVENLGTAFLGLSLQCARCHTHKYDPVTHQEYFELLAFFNHTAEEPKDGYQYDHPPVVRAPRDIADWKDYNQLVALGSSRSDLQACELYEIEDRMTTSLVAQEGKPRKTYLLERGDYQSPSGPLLHPGVIAALGEMPPGAPRNRLGLAQWLISPEHPLVARVLINRLWQQVFGVGLVRTPEEFGLQGDHPTHPQLLDFLALEFQASGWDQKAMLRRMILSRTFRQASPLRDDLDDPENRLFARGPSFRLDAEVIRDLTLQAGGILDPFMGGEGVKPYQPAGLWESIGHRKSNTRVYRPDSGRKAFRRSIYVYWKRASPHPMMTIFDAPNRESACVGRSRTDTPLQSLALLNEPQRLASARTLAKTILHKEDHDEARIFQLFIELIGREAHKAEFAACQSLLKDLQRAYHEDPSLAQAFLEDEEEHQELVELAALTQVTATVMASDPVILLY